MNIPNVLDEMLTRFDNVIKKLEVVEAKMREERGLPPITETHADTWEDEIDE